MPTGNGDSPPRLVVTAPARLAGTVWELTRAAHVVGRFGDIRLSAPDVSKRHAELRRGSDGVWLDDLNSSNGVLRNGERVQPGRPVRLAEGDRLQFGSMFLTFHQGTPNADTVTDLGAYRTRRPPGDPRNAAGDPPDPPPSYAPPPPVQDDARSATTRYLAAATQLDIDFADLVVRQVIDEPFRALAPVFGADLGVVTRWALSARRRRLLRDLALLTVLSTLLITIAQGVLSHQDELTSGSPESLGDWWQRYAVLAVLLPAVAWLVLALDTWVTEYLVLRRKMTHGRFDPADAPGPVSGRARDRLAAVAERPAGNVIVCSDFWPFAGSGDQVSEWDIPIDIRRGTPLPEGRGRRDPRPFSTGELYDALITAARELGLANLRAEERLFVDGRDLTRDRDLLPDPFRPPVTRIPVPLMRAVPGGLSATRRSYVSVEVPAWSGQLVLTMFLRAVQVKGTLYLEWSAYVLLPMRRVYYGVDHLPRRSSAGCAVRALAAAGPRVLPALLSAPRALARRAAADGAASAIRRRQRREIRDGYLFDYGAGMSIREIARGLEPGRYFLDRDQSRILQTTEQHLMLTITDFLDSRGIDSESFQRFQQNIFNDNRDFSFRNNKVSGGEINHGQYVRNGARPGRGGGPAPGQSARRG
ncbi:FHA domain-containing protein [Streptomyces sp. NPDC002928]|uniref:FHA domain-containing protein n=1 Tax=Streptomyces sp. NPDC002928 TaxID=3154440 RepID=UPI0033BA33F5